MNRAPDGPSAALSPSPATQTLSPRIVPPEPSKCREDKAAVIGGALCRYINGASGAAVGRESIHVDYAGSYINSTVVSRKVAQNSISLPPFPCPDYEEPEPSAEGRARAGGGQLGKRT